MENAFIIDQKNEILIVSVSEESCSILPFIVTGERVKNAGITQEVYEQSVQLGRFAVFDASTKAIQIP